MPFPQIQYSIPPPLYTPAKIVNLLFVHSEAAPLHSIYQGVTLPGTYLALGDIAREKLNVHLNSNYSQTRNHEPSARNMWCLR